MEETKTTEQNSNSERVASYVAHTKKSEQIAEDSWDVFTITKICTRETTLGEIEDWLRKEFRNNNAKLYCNISAST